MIGNLLADAFWSGIAALGFSMLFNVPQRALPACVLCGAIGHGSRALTMELGGSIIAGTLVGATVVGFLGWFFAYRYKIPSPVFTVSGAIPMVPGVFAFRTMIFLLQITNTNPEIGQTALLNAATNGITTGLILGAIAVGIAAPSLFFDRHKPVV